MALLECGTPISDSDLHVFKVTAQAEELLLLSPVRRRYHREQNETSTSLIRGDACEVLLSGSRGAPRKRFKEV